MTELIFHYINLLSNILPWSCLATVHGNNLARKFLSYCKDVFKRSFVLHSSATGKYHLWWKPMNEKENVPKETSACPIWTWMKPSVVGHMSMSVWYLISPHSYDDFHGLHHRPPKEIKGEKKRKEKNLLLTSLRLPSLPRIWVYDAL